MSNSATNPATALPKKTASENGFAGAEPQLINALRQEVNAKEQLINDTEELLQFGTWSWEKATDKVTLSNGLFALLGCKPVEHEINGTFPLQFISQQDVDALMAKAKKSAENKKGFEHVCNLVTK